MNHGNLDKLIFALEGAKDEQFNMRLLFAGKSGKRVQADPLHRCGTAACIAGWALHCAKLPRDGAEEAENWLGLDWREGGELFLPFGYDSQPKDFPRRRAIDVLKHLKATGKVDWESFPVENYREGRS